MSDRAAANRRSSYKNKQLDTVVASRVGTNKTDRKCCDSKLTKQKRSDVLRYQVGFGELVHEPALNRRSSYKDK